MDTASEIVVVTGRWFILGRQSAVFSTYFVERKLRRS